MTIILQPFDNHNAGNSKEFKNGVRYYVQLLDWIPSSNMTGNIKIFYKGILERYLKKIIKKDTIRVTHKILKIGKIGKIKESELA